MDKDLMIYFDEEGVAKAYDDTYDITIHCESEEEQQKAIEQLKSLQWIPCRERTPETGYAEDRLTIASYIVTMQRTTKDKKYSGVRVDYARFIPERKDGKWQGGTWQNDWLVSNENYDTEVIAWMPIPDPYDPIKGAMNPPE